MTVASLKSIGAYALVLVGVATLVVLSALSLHPSRAGAASRSPALSGTAALSMNSSISGSDCAAVPVTAAAAENLRQSQVSARALLDEGDPGEALMRFRSIAAADAGLPGIQLDLSTALLKARQTDAAKAAINAQLTTSECLAKLRPEALVAFCKLQMRQSTAVDCRQELASIERSAHFQSALVQMELANSLSGKTPSLNTAGGSTFHQPERTPAPKLFVAVHRNPLTPKTGPATAKPSAGNPLAAGAGTDAAFGAYAK